MTGYTISSAKAEMFADVYVLSADCSVCLFRLDVSLSSLFLIFILPVYRVYYWRIDVAAIDPI